MSIKDLYLDLSLCLLSQAFVTQALYVLIKNTLLIPKPYLARPLADYLSTPYSLHSPREQ